MKKARNGAGAKGGREDGDVKANNAANENWRQCLENRLNKPETGLARIPKSGLVGAGLKVACGRIVCWEPWATGLKEGFG